MNRPETVRQLRWLMILRVVTVTTLLISAFAVELLLMPGDTLRPLFVLAAAAYALVLLYAALDRWIGGRPALLYVQLTGDTLIVTAFVAITGGLDSAMSFLYLLPICVASLLLYRRGGLVIGGLSWLLYAGLTVGVPGWIAGGSAFSTVQRHPGRVLYALVVHLVGMLAVALLSSYFSERVRNQGRELDERRGTVARLQALNENIIESINSGLITTDLEGRIHFVNRGGTEITGIPAKRIEGRQIEGFFGLEPGSADGIRRRLRANRRLRFERWFESGSGERLFLGIAVSNLHDRAGKRLGYIYIFQDLTEIHALEQEVRLKERMAALGEMAAGMAHELRNPLASISGSVQYLRGQIEAGGEARELMDIILRESQRLDHTIGDFLTFARPGRFNPVEVDLVPLIEDSIRLLEKSSELRSDHRIERVFEEPNMPAEVDGDRIKQVFWNLACNALRAMPEGGTLRVELASRDAGRTVELAFDDEGRGMDEQQRSGYFQPFSSSFEGGTGLGAAIVYRLIEEHGGRIAVDSAPERGTRIGIRLPRWRESGVLASRPLEVSVS